MTSYIYRPRIIIPWSTIRFMGTQAGNITVETKLRLIHKSGITANNSDVREICRQSFGQHKFGLKPMKTQTSEIALQTAEKLEGKELLIYLYLRHGCVEWALDLLYSLLEKNCKSSQNEVNIQNATTTVKAPINSKPLIDKPPAGVAKNLASHGPPSSETKIVGSHLSTLIEKPHHLSASSSKELMPTSNSNINIHSSTPTSEGELKQDLKLPMHPSVLLYYRLIINPTLKKKSSKKIYSAKTRPTNDDHGIKKPTISLALDTSKMYLNTPNNINRSPNHVNQDTQISTVKENLLRASNHRIVEVQSPKPSLRIILLVLRHLFKIKLRREAFHLVNSVFEPLPQVAFPTIPIAKIILKKPTVSLTKIPLDEDSFDAILFGLADGHYMTQAVRFLLSWHRPNGHHYTSVINGYLTLQPPDIHKALELIKEMHKLGLKVGLPQLTALFAALCKLKSVVTEKYMKHKILNDKLLENRKEAVAILEMLKPLGIIDLNLDLAPDVLLYTRMLQFKVYESHVKSPDDLMKDMAKNGIVPDVHFYNTLIRMYLKQKNLTAVNNLLEAFTPNAKTLSLLLQYYSVNNLDIKFVIGLYQTHCIALNKFSSTILMIRAFREHDTRNALDYFGQMIGYDFQTHKRTQLDPWMKADNAVIGMMIKYLLTNNGFLVQDVMRICQHCGFHFSRHMTYLIRNA